MRMRAGQPHGMLSQTRLHTGAFLKRTRSTVGRYKEVGYLCVRPVEARAESIPRGIMMHMNEALNSRT